MFLPATNLIGSEPRIAIGTYLNRHYFCHCFVNQKICIISILRLIHYFKKLTFY